MAPDTDLVIVGGGAAGLAAAVFCAQAHPDRRIVLLEGSRRLGTKILVSGGGRCNVTHRAVCPEDFNANRNVVRNVLAALTVPQTIDWFADLGVPLKRESTGKLFPVTDSAHTVLDALLNRCRALGVVLRTDCRVQAVQPTPDGFMVEHAQGELRAPRLILAAGGRSLPKSGSDGSGWTIARQLGHGVTPTYPALVPLVLADDFFHAPLSGIALEVQLTTVVGNKPIDTRAGAMLFTHFGISGPVAMDASRHWIIAHQTGQNPILRCNLLHPDGFERVERWLVPTIAQRPRAAVAAILQQRLPERVAAALLPHVQLDASITGAHLARASRRRLIHALTALPLPVVGPRGWDFAEVTAGGVPLAEIDPSTMASRKCPGLHLIGEILDCDGRIGGFNFQWAWSTAAIAARAVFRA